MANHHLIKIREFYPGLAATANDSFLELQMYTAGQNMTGGHIIRIYPPGSSGPDPNFVLNPTVNPPNPESQRTILAAGSSGAMPRDYTENLDGAPSFNPAGGALCFVSSSVFGDIDCVEWGTGNTNVSADPPVLPGGIPDGSSITRAITPGCATLLEAGDDTGNSGADFAATIPTPRSNVVMPTETACNPPPPPGGGATPAQPTPKKKCKQKKKKGKGKSAVTAAKKKCKKKK